MLHPFQSCLMAAAAAGPGSSRALPGPAAAAAAYPPPTGGVLPSIQPASSQRGLLPWSPWWLRRWVVLSRVCVSERLVSRLQDDRTVEILEDLVLRYGDDKCPEYITFPERTKLVASEDVR